jgi:hypothetical protein
MFPLILMSVAGAIGVAVLKYRLYDIDLIINRTLVYVPLTAILAGVYIALAGFLRVVITQFTGASSDVAIALSTLGVVALLTPIKNQLQALVDRRFKEAPEPRQTLKKLLAQMESFVTLLDSDSAVRLFLKSATEAMDAEGGAVQVYRKGGRLVTYGNWNGKVGLTVDLKHSGAVIGLLHMGPNRKGRTFSDAEAKFLAECAPVLANTIIVTGSIRSN